MEAIEINTPADLVTFLLSKSKVLPSLFVDNPNVGTSVPYLYNDLCLYTDKFSRLKSLFSTEAVFSADLQDYFESLFSCDESSNQDGFTTFYNKILSEFFGALAGDNLSGGLQ